MKRILINDGIHPDGQKALEDAGFEVITDKIEQDQLPSQLPAFDAIAVRSATKVRQDLIDQCPNLKVIARGGVGLDNIDVEHAKSKGIQVINTPAASSQAVAELVFMHLFSVARFGYESNRKMPADGASNFKGLKKGFSKGFQLRGKTIGIIGMGRIGQETARIALGIGMNVLAVDPYVSEVKLSIDIAGASSTEVALKTIGLDEMLGRADIISLHIPFLGKPALGAEEFGKMKKGMVLINASRGGTVDEDALLTALEDGTVLTAGLDVFLNEPTPREDLLNHPKISLTPHIGASTVEAQRNIGLELAEKVTAALS